MTSRRGYEAGKRALDVTVALIVLVVAAPLMALIAAALWIDIGRPVLFRQKRPGRHGELFELVKFRGMVPPDPATGRVEDGDRLTPFTRWLRSTSMDELPSMVNVLRGEMSLVGPRPLLVRYLDRYSPEQARRHDVKPGVTGLAQVSGRNMLAWEQRFAYDVFYVNNRGMLLDLRVLVLTVGAVLRRKGIRAPRCAATDEFVGSPSELPSRAVSFR